MHNLIDMFEKSGSVESYVKSYADRLHEVLLEMDGEAIGKIIDAIEKVSLDGGTLFTMANGGSAAACSHLVNDLVAGSYVEGKPSLRTYCLSDNVESITAIANDAGYENVFLQQLRVNMKPGDVVMAMSVSGNSENIIRGIDYANANGAVTIGYTGFDGGKLREACGISVHVPTTKDEYGPVEDAFNILGHLVSGYIAMQRGKRLHH
jgi:D-sedoheptulose 7-phosphate isomerase